MKVTEAKFTRRYNVGQYEHEEYTVTAQVEDGDSTTEVLATLKSEVASAHAGEASQGAGQDEAEETGTGKRSKKGKKSKKSRTTTQEDESEDEDTASEEDETEDTEEEEDGSDDSADSDGDSSDDESEIESEDDDESEDDEEETEEEKKPVASKKTSKDGAKKFKKKPQNYSRSNDAHKELFSKVLGEVAPNWKKTDKSKALAKKASVKAEGKEFLDENGKVLATFKAFVKKFMAAK